jgi:hypothetical protein
VTSQSNLASQPRSSRKKAPKEPNPLISATKCLELLNRPCDDFQKNLAIDYFVFIELKLYKYSSKTFTPVSSSQKKVVQRDRKQ